MEGHVLYQITVSVSLACSTMYFTKKTECVSPNTMHVSQSAEKQVTCSQYSKVLLLQA